ncbi:MAG TPA: hypothetical protein VMH02_01960 [Verrucomicrobiae bacterium]|nr:hypothetical protein [Verrucomicrobiae bacterium]
MPLSEKQRAALRAAITDAVERAIIAFLADPDPTVSAEARWRQAMRIYAPGSWNHDIATRLPFALFRMMEIVNRYSLEIRALHPDAKNYDAGVSNALSALVRDGFLQKVARGVYGPALDGVLLVPRQLNSGLAA